MHKFRFFLVSCFCIINAQAANETHYRAAVIEYTCDPRNYSANTQNYLNFVKEASQNGVDILVFPEDGWDGPCTVVPHPDEQIVPCDSIGNRTSTSAMGEGLKQLSCAAKESSIYVVANLCEVSPCPNCKHGSLQYNTNVVLDRNGTIVSRYRKVNLFADYGSSRTPEPDISYFDTDFGVRFGTFICFDILFKTPPLKLARDTGITDFVYNAHWYSTLPFATAVQVQEMWSYSLDVNMVASGLNGASTGSGGSGIYAGRQGAIVRTFPNVKTSEILIADVPKKGSRTNGQAIKRPLNLSNTTTHLLLTNEHLGLYRSVLLDNLKEGEELCHDGVCCTFSVDYSAPVRDLGYKYHAVAFNGVKSVAGFATLGVQVCSIVSCSGDDVESCGVLIPSEHTFTNVNITGIFTNVDAFHIPTSLRLADQLLPYQPDKFGYESVCGDETCSVSITSKGELENLITFGVYCRNYARDGEKVKAVSLPTAIADLEKAYLRMKFHSPRKHSH